MSSFRDLHPKLSQEHVTAMHEGRQLAEEQLKTLAIRWGIRISSAVKCHQTEKKCSYEEACVAFVRACDEVALSFHYIQWAMEEKEAADSPDVEAA